MAAAKGNKYVEKRKWRPQHSKEEIQEIVDRLTKWAYEEDGVFISSFTYENYKKGESWLYNLADHHPEIKEALSIAKSLLAAKIGKHCYIGDRNSSFGEKILPIYSEEYKKETERKARLSQAAAGESSLSLSDVVKMVQSGELIRLLSQAENKILNDD